MALSCCLKCTQPLEHPDKTHRYCPYCGFLRVLPDPPGGPPDGSFITVGLDCIGDQSGEVYAYRRPDEVPRQISPLATLPNGSWRELYAASSTPCPEGALYATTLPRAFTSVRGPAEKACGPLWQVAVRHTRLFALARGGQIQALDTRTLEYARSWRFPVVPGATRSTTLHVSETLVYCLIPTPGSTELLAYDIGCGRLQIHQSLPFLNARATIAGGYVLALGEAEGRQQSVLCYRMSDYPEPGDAGAGPIASVTPFQKADLIIAGSDGTRNRPMRLGQGH